jgi:hypothetical protein
METAVMNFYSSIAYTEDVARTMWVKYKDMSADMIWSHLESQYGSIIAPFKAEVERAEAKRKAEIRIFETIEEFYRSIGYDAATVTPMVDRLRANYNYGFYETMWFNLESEYGEVRVAPWKAKAMGYKVPTSEEYLEDWTYDVLREMLVIILCKESRRLDQSKTMDAIQDSARALAGLARAGYGDSYDALWERMEEKYGKEAIEGPKYRSRIVPALPAP